MSSAPSTVYQGFWVNYSQGKIHGSTLTLTLENGALFIAVIALFVRFAGGQLWSVLTFLVSITRSTAEPRDALYHQQQAILRNTSQPSSVVWAMLKLPWFWRGDAKKANTRALVFVFGSLTYIAAFSVAGIFSSRISSTDSEVLLIPAQPCGTWPYPWYSEYDPAKETMQNFIIRRTEYFSDFNQVVNNAHIYVKECYNSTLSDSNEFCFPSGRSRITWSTDLHAACPFEGDICIADSIRVDTGFIDSRNHFGINTGNDRVEYRRIATCAPITTEGYATGWVNESGLNLWESGSGFIFFEDQTWQVYSYGPGENFNDTLTNATFAFSNLTFSGSIGTLVPWRIFDME